jgi:molecular chaperone DnaK
MERIIGIDLGTTNSCVAIVEGGQPVVLANKGGYKTTPSVVAVLGERQAAGGSHRQAAGGHQRPQHRLCRQTPHRAALGLGRRCARWSSRCPTPSSKGPNDDPRIKLRDRVYSVPEISSIILQEMRLVAEEYTGEKIEKAVITVPGLLQRRAAAGHQGCRPHRRPRRGAHHQRAHRRGAGLRLRQRRRQAPSRCTTSAAAPSTSRSCEIANGVFEVLATAGDTFLGGEDFDGRIIMDWLVLEFAREHQIDLRQDKMALQRLRDAAEKAKIELSSARETEINLPFIISTGGSDALHLQKTLTREKLESLTVDLVERTIKICKKTVEEAGEPIDDVLLVGGMTRMPLVQREGARVLRQGARSRACTPTRSWPSAPPSRARRCCEDSQRCCCSTSPRCRSAS